MEMFLILKLKSLHYAARKYLKKNALKMLMKQNHATMMPKKYRYVLILIENQHSMMQENIEKPYV